MKTADAFKSQVLGRISKEDIRDFLGKGWLPHDGMWFYHTYQALGIKTANQLNQAAIHALAPIEVKRVKQIPGIGESDLVSLNDTETFMLNALETNRGAIPS